MIRITRSSRMQPISITVSVTTSVVRGTVGEQEFAAWLQHAVEDYHRFRAGYVGITAHATITLPTVRRVK